MLDAPESNIHNIHNKSSIKRSTAAWLVALLFILGLGLRLYRFDAFLPNIFHSDYGQLTQSQDYFTKGKINDNSSYPLGNVYGYIAADYITYPIGLAAGWWSDYDTFIAELTDVGDPTLRHRIARVYTAILGGLITFAVYKLARVYFSRRTALVAAALATLSPVHIIYCHQVRIHAPGIVFVTFSAVAVARMLRKPESIGRAARAGLVVGVIATIIQLGVFVFGCALLLLLFFRRPLLQALKSILICGSAFGAAAFTATYITHPASIVFREASKIPKADETILGIPKATIKGFSVERFLTQFPSFLTHYAAAEPAIAAGVLLFMLASLVRRGDRRLLVIYGLYPAVIFVILGTTYTVTRYSMSATPFLAILAAAALLQIRPRFLAAAAAVGAVALPASLSIRYLQLLSREDSRLVLDLTLQKLAAENAKISVENFLVLNPYLLPPNVSQFPPGGDYSIWAKNSKETPQRTFARVLPDIYIDDRSPIGMSSCESPESLNYTIFGYISGGVPGEGYLPDTPDYLIPDLFIVDRCGPSIRIWTRTPADEDRLAKFMIEEIEKAK